LIGHVRDSYTAITQDPVRLQREYLELESIRTTARDATQKLVAMLLERRRHRGGSIKAAQFSTSIRAAYFDLVRIVNGTDTSLSYCATLLAHDNAQLPPLTVHRLDEHVCTHTLPKARELMEHKKREMLYNSEHYLIWVPQAGTSSSGGRSQTEASEITSVSSTYEPSQTSFADTTHASQPPIDPGGFVHGNVHMRSPGA